MLRSDEPITLLIEKLDGLPRPDRIAILGRLSPRERTQIERVRLRQRQSVAESYSPGIIQRIAELDGDKGPMTPAAREALRGAVKREALAPGREGPRGTSLADAVGSWFGKRGRA